MYVRKFIEQKTAFITALILLASFHLGLQFHLAVPDPYLIFFITWSLFLFYSWYTEKKIRDILLFYLAIALGILSKGPVAIILPGITVFIFLLAKRSFNFKTIKELKLIWGLLIILLIASPWFYAAHINTNGDWTKGFLLDHNINRFSSPKEGHGGNFLLTIFYVLIGLFPFSVFLFQSLYKAITKRNNTILLYSLISSLTIVVFFCFSDTRLPNYTVPAYPFLAIIIAHYLVELKSKWKIIIPQIIALVISVLIVLLGIYFFNKINEFKNIRYQFIVMGFIFLGIAISLFQTRKSEPIKYVLPVAIGSSISVILFFTILFPSMMKQNPLMKSKSIIENKKEIAYWHKMNVAYPFYLKKKVEPIYDENEFKDFFIDNPEGIIISTLRHLRISDKNDTVFYDIAFESSDLLDPDTTVLLIPRANVSNP